MKAIRNNIIRAKKIIVRLNNSLTEYTEFMTCAINEEEKKKHR